MTTNRAHPATENQTSGPLPPVPPVGPVKKVGNIANAIKVFLVTTVGMALKYAWSANAHFTNWDDFSNLGNWTHLAQVTFNAFVYGLISGSVLGLIVLLAAIAGPELWSWIGPIVLAAATTTMKVIRGISLSFRGLPANPEKPHHSKETND
jgi:hypothetical protein